MLAGFDKPRTPPIRPGTTDSPSSTGSGVKNGSQRAARRYSRSRRTAGSTTSTRGERVPYLNVITNFSKLNSTTIRAPAMYIHRRNESLQERRRKGRGDGGSKGRIEDMKATEPTSGLSPSDRELLIGLSIPSSPSNTPQLHSQTLLKPCDGSPNPEIVITPADETPPSELQRTTRQRAASSVYSRFPNGVPYSGSEPAVPKISRYSTATSIETSSRCTSWATDFSEDDTLKTSRPESRGDQNLVPELKSAVSFDTKRGSHGWWSQLLSPFFEKSPYTHDFPSETSTLHQELLDSREGNWKIAKSSHAKAEKTGSIWADLTAHSMAKHGKVLLWQDRDPNLHDYPGVHRGELVETPSEIDESPQEGTIGTFTRSIPFSGDRSPEIMGVQGMGLAAEYFEAYWHDQNNPTPFFQCENHLCSYGRGISKIGFGLAGDCSADRDMGLADASHDAGEDIPFAFPTRIQSLQKELPDKPGHTRQASDTTVIEEESDPSIGNAAPAHPPVEAFSESTSRPLPPLPRDTSDSRVELAAEREIPAPLHPHNKAADPDEPSPRYPPLAGLTEPRQAPPHPYDKAANLDEPAPRYPPFVGLVEPRQAPAPFLGSAFSPPTPHEHSTPAAFSDRESKVPKPTVEAFTSSQFHFERFENRSNVHEINDSHPDQTFPPPPMIAEPKKNSVEKTGKEKEKKKGGLLGLVACGGRNKSREQKKRRRLFCCIFTGLLLMVVVILVLVIELTLPRNDMPVQTAWLNLTGYPPLPTGIATIARPNVEAVDGCIAPSTMWSCALPKEQQASIAPNPADQPNFRIEIRFLNGTNLTGASTPTKRNIQSRGLSFTQFMRRQALQVRDSFSSGLFAPNPVPPSLEDQNFLGNTTDGNSKPFAGEPTPFYMSILNADTVSTASQRLLRRQTASGSNSTNSSDPFPNLADDIPPPSINSDGTAAAANLYPFPTAQPLMLYDRGLGSEHYGFYTYFDRSIFLRSGSVENISTIGVVPDDENGGSLEDEASLRCTWAQTRFLVQIWTNTQGSLPLISSNGSTANSSTSSANDFEAPGSFPYPVSITMDRHGGDINSKSVYCYGVNDRQQIVSSEKQFQLENRSFGGHLVNPALGLFNHINVSVVDGGPGGIDGGNGGCSCLWRNFVADG